jgi:acyl carrier protein
MSNPVFDRLAEVIRTTLKQPEAAIAPETTADDVDGWDSLTHSVLLMRIERAFGVRFEPAEVMALENVGQLARLVESKV